MATDVACVRLCPALLQAHVLGAAGSATQAQHGGEVDGAAQAVELHAAQRCDRPPSVCGAARQPPAGTPVLDLRRAQVVTLLCQPG